MSLDLQKIPCYDSSNCKEIYNCAPTTSIYACDKTSSPNSPGIPNCTDGETHSYCFGSDPNYCSGIIQQCDPNSGYYCQPSISNPAVNYFSENLGCDVINDASCMEFEKFAQCQDDCWNLGGSSEVGNVCGELFKDMASCNSMKYFCEWNSTEGVCNETSQDPWKNFLQLAPQNDGKPAATTSENIGDGLVLNCAQSSWSSDQITSYADTIRTCCIGKKCVTTPRCQFVENTYDCGFKDIDYYKNPSYNAISSISDSVKNPWFICEDTQQSLIVGTNSFLKKGYCTWCKGSQLQNFDYRNWLINSGILTQGHDIRYSDAWNGSNNRCSNYNQCENGASEIAWNECIWRHSQGNTGVDPTSQNPDLSKGFCYSSDCLKNATSSAQIDECNNLISLKNICENELLSKVSTKNQLVTVSVNMGFPTERCSEGTNWNHSCIQSNNITYAENFACGWCPNLQNDWPENPCVSDNTLNTALSAWYDPLLIGLNKDQIQNQEQTIGCVILITILVIIAVLSWLLGYNLFKN